MVSNTIFSRIQLFGSSSNEVKEGNIQMGHFGLIEGKEVQDIGNSFDCVIIAWRPKAVEFNDEEVNVVHDPDSEEFKRIQELSTQQDTGCMWGPEFLLYIPSFDKFVPYHLNNASSRYAAKSFAARLQKAATITAQLIKNKKYSWHAPSCNDCSVPIENIPAEDRVQEEFQRFINPETEAKEIAEETDRTV
jgi:hypothetical protein